MFNKGDKVYLPKLGDDTSRFGIFQFSLGDMASIEWKPGFVTEYPLEYVEHLPKKAAPAPIAVDYNFLYLVLSIVVGLAAGAAIVWSR